MSLHYVNAAPKNPTASTSAVMTLGMSLSTLMDFATSIRQLSSLPESSRQRDPLDFFTSGGDGAVCPTYNRLKVSRFDLRPAIQGHSIVGQASSGLHRVI